MKERKFLIRKHFSHKFKWTSKKWFPQRRWKQTARNPKNFTSMCEKDENFFSSNFIFPLCPMVNRMQFWQPCRKFLQAFLKILTQTPKKMKKNFDKKLSSKRYLRLRQRKEFWRTRRNFLPEGRKIFTQFTEMKKWIFSFHLIISAKIFGIDT